MIHRSPLSLGGVHDQTSALRDLLAADRIEAPHTGLPPSEALLLGLGGGIGAAVFTFQYQGHLPHLYVETRCTPQFAYDLAFVQRAAAGLGLSLTVTTATSAKAATKALDAVLAAGRPALCLVDANTLPHHAGTKGMGALPWVVVVHDQRGDMVSITDRTPVRFEISRASLDAARASYAKGKNAVASLQPGNTGSLTAGKLTAGIRAGIHYCVEELAGREVKKGFGGNFGLRALDKWIAELSRKGRTVGERDLRLARRSPPGCARRTLGSRRTAPGAGAFVDCTPTSCAKLQPSAVTHDLSASRRAMTNWPQIGPRSSPHCSRMVHHWVRSAGCCRSVRRRCGAAMRARSCLTTTARSMRW